MGQSTNSATMVVPLMLLMGFYDALCCYFDRSFTALLPKCFPLLIEELAMVSLPPSTVSLVRWRPSSASTQVVPHHATSLHHSSSSRVFSPSSSHSSREESLHSDRVVYFEDHMLLLCRYHLGTTLQCITFPIPCFRLLCLGEHCCCTGLIAVVGRRYQLQRW